MKIIPGVSDKVTAQKISNSIKYIFLKKNVSNSIPCLFNNYCQAKPLRTIHLWQVFLQYKTELKGIRARGMATPDLYKVRHSSSLDCSNFHRVHQCIVRLTRIKRSSFLDYLANSKDLDRNSRVEKKHCITSRRIPDFYHNFLSRWWMYNILLSGAQLKMGTPKSPKNTFFSIASRPFVLISRLLQVRRR